MRISTANMYATSVATMNAQEQAVFTAQQQVSTGKRILSPEDDPVGAASAVRLNQQISRNTNFANNRASAESQLNQVGTTLTSVTNLLTSVKSSIVQAGNASLDPSQKQAIATQLQQQMQELQGYANTQDGNGEYLFAGWQVHTQPYVLGNYANTASAAGNTGSGSLSVNTISGQLTASQAASINISQTDNSISPTQYTYTVNGQAGGTVASGGQFTVNGVQLTLNGTPALGDTFTLSPSATLYQGDTGTRPVEINDGRELSTTLAGPSVFDSVPTGNGTFATSATVGNLGSGIIDQGSVTDPTKLTHDNYAIQFSGAPAASAAASNTGTAKLAAANPAGSLSTNDSYQLSFANGGSTYSVIDTTSGATVASNQAYTAGSAISVMGANFSMTGTPAAGDQFTIAPGPATSYSVVDLTKTTPDPANPNGPGIPASVLSNQPFTSGQAIKFGGMSVSVTGAPVNGDSFSVEPSTSTSIFSIMKMAIDALNNPGSGTAGSTQYANQINQANAGIDAALTQVDLNQATVGGRINELTSLDSTGAQQAITLQQQLTTITSVDFTAAVSTLTQAQTALAAAQKSFTQVAGLSLFNYIQ